jgi:hypothetical protein
VPLLANATAAFFYDPRAGLAAGTVQARVQRKYLSSQTPKRSDCLRWKPALSAARISSD